MKILETFKSYFNRLNKSYLIVTLLFLSLLGVERALHGQLSQIIHKLIKSEIAKRQVKLDFQSTDYGFFPPHIVLKDLAFNKNSLVVNAQSVAVSLKILPLIKGQFILNGLYGEKIAASYKIDKKNKPTEPLPQVSLDMILETIPFQFINIKDSNFYLLNGEDVFQSRIEKALLTKQDKNLLIEVKSKIDVEYNKFKESFFFVTKAKWQKKGFFVNFVTLQKKESIIQFSGFLKEEILNLKNIELKNIFEVSKEFRINSDLNLEELDRSLQFLTSTILPEENLKKTPYKGRLQASGYYYDSKTRKDNEKSTFTITGKNISSPFAQFYAFKTKGRFDSRSLETSDFLIHFNKEQSLRVENLSLSKKGANTALSLNLKAHDLSVENILSSLYLSGDNIVAPFSINSHCGGFVQKKITLQCEGEAKLKKLKIITGNNNLVSTRGLSTKFKAYVFSNKLSFNATATDLGDAPSLAEASGEVDYLKGFDIAFKASHLNLDLINEISGLSFSGLSSLEGSTKGSSKWGKFEITTKNSDLIFNDIFVGDNSLDISYAFPNLRVQNIKGALNDQEPRKNSYKGNIRLQIEESNLFVNLEGSNLNNKGVQKSFSALFPFPDGIFFNSNFKLEASKGVDINKMDLNLKADISNIDIFGERFKSGRLFISGENGHWLLKQAALFKESSVFKTRGHIEGLNEIDLHMTSENFDIKNSTFLQSLGLILSGPLEIRLDAVGPIKGPRADGRASSVKLIGAQGKLLGASQTYYRLYDTHLYFDGSFFNNRIEGKGSYPLDSNGSLGFQGDFQNFDIFSLVNINHARESKSKFNLSSHLNINTPSLKNTEIEGTVKDTYLELISNDQSLVLFKQSGPNTNVREPLSIDVKQVGSTSQISTYLSKKNTLNFTFTGRLLLDFLIYFIPETEIIRGDFIAPDGVGFKVSPNQAYLEGQAHLKEVLYKSSIFPYPISNIESPINLKGQTILFSNLSATINESPVHGQGTVNLSPKKWGLSFNFNYKNLLMDFPEGIKSFSNANLYLKGDRFPLLLGGTMDVHSGVFSIDLLNASSAEVVSPNKRLPKEILKKMVPPVELDLKINISSKMMVQNNEAEGYVYGKIHAKENPIDPILNGHVQLAQGLKIFFNGNTFILNEGYVVYTNDLTGQPQVLIDAVSNIKDNNDPLETFYEIRMIAKGLASDPNVKFLSSPPLSENQILSLLTMGTVSTQKVGSEINSQNQAAYSGFQVGSYLVQKNQALRDLQKKTGTEIGISSSVNSGGVSPKVYVKKSWSPKTSSTISQSFGNQRSFEASTQYKLNQRTSTVLKVQNTQTEDATLLINRRNREDIILDLGLQYQFEFD